VLPLDWYSAIPEQRELSVPLALNLLASLLLSTKFGPIAQPRQGQPIFEREVALAALSLIVIRMSAL
jgi:hypothetical protein